MSQVSIHESQQATVATSQGQGRTIQRGLAQTSVSSAATTSQQGRQAPTSSGTESSGRRQGISITDNMLNHPITVTSDPNQRNRPGPADHSTQRTQPARRGMPLEGMLNERDEASSRPVQSTRSARGDRSVDATTNESDKQPRLLTQGKQALRDRTTKQKGEFRCPEPDCSRTFQTQRGLSAHLGGSHLGKPTSQSLDRSDVSATDLQILVDLQHSDEGKKAIQCLSCRVNYNGWMGLQNHRGQSHKGEIGCRYCGYVAKTLEKLGNHEVDHRTSLLPASQPREQAPLEHAQAGQPRFEESHIRSTLPTSEQSSAIPPQDWQMYQTTNDGKWHCKVHRGVWESLDAAEDHRAVNHSNELPLASRAIAGDIAETSNTAAGRVRQRSDSDPPGPISDPSRRKQQAQTPAKKKTKKTGNPQR